MVRLVRTDFDTKEDSEYLLKNLTKIDPKEQQKYLNLITKATNLD